MRALLVTNPFATATNAEHVAKVEKLLAAQLVVTTISTSHRENAIDVGKSATRDKFDLVISLGGDGTANEIINGLMLIKSDERPIFASLPGGNANVLTRNLGFTNKIDNAVDQLLESLQQNNVINLGLGHVSATTSHNSHISRYFAFNAGLGIDAEVLLAMHELRNRGKKVTDAAYAGLALRKIFRWMTKKSPQLLISNNKYFFAFVLNLSPWTYISSWAVNPAPQVSVNNALSIFAAKNVAVKSFFAVLSALAFGRKFTEVADLDSFVDCQSLDVSALSPVWLQVDGEPLDQVTQADFSHHPDTLKVLCAKNV